MERDLLARKWPASQATLPARLQEMSVHGSSNFTVGFTRIDFSKKLYGLGGRKFVLMAVNPLGCSPSATVSTPSGSGCIQSLNRAAKLFNSNLRDLVLHLTLTLRGSHFVLVNSYKIINNIINDPLPKGFTNTGMPCCEVPTLAQGGNGLLCKMNGSVCANHTNHVFFDGLHPTESVNIYIANKGFSSGRSSEVYPFNIQRLASL